MKTASGAVMKTVPLSRKKKDSKADVVKDTVADTIAFVIKGQLTPIKAISALPDSKKHVLKRLQKGRSCKTTMSNKDELINSKKRENGVKTTKSAKSKGKSSKKDLDSSIQKIIKKYAKKFNIKRNTQNDVKKSKKSARISKLRQSDKSVEVQDEDKPLAALSVKVKEEKVDEFPATVKVESKNELPLINIKQEPVANSGEDEPLPTSSKTPNKVVKKRMDPKKLRLLKRKALVCKQMDDKRRAKLLQFWNSPKRHRVASLNALAKVHCLYENESKATMDKITEHSIIKKELLPMESRRHRKLSDSSSDSCQSDSDQPVRRTLRDVPGLRGAGKHWDMSISSDNNSDVEVRCKVPRKVIRVKREPKKVEKKTVKVDDKDDEDEEEKQAKSRAGRKPKQEVFMDLKDMVVKKRMASLNASAILAASYSNDKKKSSNRTTTESSSYDSDSSAEEYFAAIQQIDLTKNPKEEIKQEDDGNLIEVHATPNKKVAVIVNQDTDVTITGVYVNSTTRSTHHEGYCSIAGMQYRISATSHTQTAATTVATETLLQSGSSSDNAHSDGQSCSSKSYTPLDALSNMQPPPGPGIHSSLPGHPGLPCQPGPQMASPSRRHHSSSSAFNPAHHGPSGCLPPPRESPGYIHGYYQPAGPLISVPHSHGQPPIQQPPLPKSVPLSEASPTSVNSSVHQSQNVPAPGSNNGDSSDNDVIITSVTSGIKEPPAPQSHQPSAPYRYPQYSQYHPYAPCPPQYHYQTPPPPPTPPGYPAHELCYPTGPPASYLRHAAKYATSPAAAYHRYPYFTGHAGELYPGPSGAAPPQASQQIVSANQVTGSGAYPPATSGPPPPSALMESYPVPPAPPALVDAYQPASHYYPSAYSLPSACYSHSPSRAIPYATYQHCPCPLNTCPKNGHTGPLTGESKRSANISKDSKPLPPVALALPLEPVSATGPPSPARGSAGMPSGGMPPPPSPAGANYQQPPPKQEAKSPEVLPDKVEKRKARVGKANVRNNMQNTMLLMCNPAQNNYVKREIESPKDKEELKSDPEVVESKLPEPCRTDVPSETQEMKVDVTLPDTSESTKESQIEMVDDPVPPKDEPLPPCRATVAENVKVKNMKRKQSQSKEQVHEPSTPPTKKPKLSLYKDFIKKHTSCFKINNGKKKLINKNANNNSIHQLPKIKLKSPTKKKMSVSKEQTNNPRMKSKKPMRKSAPKILDNLIARNVEKTIENVVKCSKNQQVKIKQEPLEVVDVIKTGAKNIKKAVAKVSRRKSTSKNRNSEVEPEQKGTKKVVVAPKWSNGWTWEGESYEGKVFINSDETTLVRKCYPSMRHREGDLLSPGDCVLLKAGPRKNDLPYVAKIAALWENPEDGEMMMSLLWYYRPEHTEQGRLPTDQPDEVFASRHKDSNSVACVDDKCYVLTFNEYCRYKKTYKRIEEGLEERPRYVPLPDPYPRMRKQPPTENVSPDMVFFCRKVYDFRQKRLIKNPT